MNFLDPRLPDCFWSKVIPEPNSGCWLWTGGGNGKGYGIVHGRSSRVAHRFSYEMLVGPVPEGLQLDHLCRQRCCVNPAHLEPVTSRENTLRGVGPSAKAARVTACPFGHPYDAENVITSDGDRRCRTCRRAASRLRKRRLTAEGACVSARAHGPAVAGVRCRSCADKMIAARERRKQNGAGIYRDKGEL